MAEKYYFDTSIWLDIYEKRGYNGEVAKKLMEKIIREDSVTVYSDFVVKEFKRLGYSEYEINVILSIAKPDHIRRIHLTKEQLIEAKQLFKKRDVPLGDIFHAILARDREAQLVSRDRDFEKIKDIAEAKLPEDLL
ncbi:MAG: PIN domain-containing protein [Nanoarchaeota archaeon]